MQRFPLDKVLTYRSHLRLEARNLLAAAMADERTLLDHRLQLERQREQQTTELSELLLQESLDVQAAGRRSLFARGLDAEMSVIDEKLVAARQRVEACRLELVKADQDVKALDRLREKHVAEQTYLEGRKAEHELEEQWLARTYASLGNM